MFSATIFRETLVWTNVHKRYDTEKHVFKAHTELSILTSNYWEKIEILIQNVTHRSLKQQKQLWELNHVFGGYFFLKHLSRELYCSQTYIYKVIVLTFFTHINTYSSKITRTTTKHLLFVGGWTKWCTHIPL